LTPDAFFQGNGPVVTGSVSNLATGNTPTQLLSLPGGIIVVSVANTVGGGVQLSIHNATGVGLPAVQAVGNTTTSITLQTTQDYMTTLTASGEQAHIQIFPSGGAFPDVVTLIVSCENQSGLPSFVAQAFTGGV
jgi:hypothetical protein